MLKKVLLMAAVALLGLPGLAHAQLGRGEISVGYGVAPVTDYNRQNEMRRSSEPDATFRGLK